jgi:hypothetical protein
LILLDYTSLVGLGWWQKKGKRLVGPNAEQRSTMRSE